MRYTTLCFAIVLGCCVQANAGDINTDSLSAIGIPDMQVMSDAQGMEVRAKGFVYGESTVLSVNLLGGGYATSTNGYVNLNPGFTVGGNFSGADAGVFAPTTLAGGFSFTN